MNGRLYRAELRNLEGWYDAERVVKMINDALAREGVEERFAALEPNGRSILSLAFADPKRLGTVAEKFPMVLRENLEAAIRDGREFEERGKRMGAAFFCGCSQSRV